MKKAQAFYETKYNFEPAKPSDKMEHKGGKTALVVGVEDPGCFFCVKITHLHGVERSHPVSMRLTLGEAFEDARKFLSEINIKEK